MKLQPKAVARTDRVLNNLSSSVMAKLITFFINFVSRSIFIAYLGKTYLSFNGLYSDILGNLSLAELGFGVTIVFSMYKPLAEHDNEKLSSLLLLYRKVYLAIGAVIFAVGIGLIPVLNLIVKLPSDVVLGSINFSVNGFAVEISFLVLYYVMHLVNTAISYFFNGYKRSILSADQREYITTNISSFLTIALTVIRITLLLILGRYNTDMAYIVYMLAGTASVITSNIIVGVISKKLYPEINIRKAKPIPRDEIKSIAKSVGSSAISRICHVALNSTDNILISAYISTLVVGNLSNYTLVTGSLVGILCMFTGAMTSSLGNFFAEKTKKEGLDLFEKVSYANLWMYGLASVALFTLLNPFITVWIHKSDYMLSILIVFALTMKFFVEGYMNTLFTFRSALGLFTQGWFRPLIVAVVNIGSSIGLALLLRDKTWFGFNDWALFGILIATVLARLSVNVWYDPIIIYKYGFNASVKPFFMQTTKILGCSTVMAVLLAVVKQFLPVTLEMPVRARMLNFILLMLITTVVCAGGFLLLNYNKPEFKFFVSRFVMIWKNITQKFKGLWKRSNR